MKDEFYKITKKLGVEQLKDFIPNTLPEDIFCVLKRVHHATNIYVYLQKFRFFSSHVTTLVVYELNVSPD